MSTSKTEDPTPKRLRDARRRGQVAKSRELVAIATLVASIVAGAALGPEVPGAFRELFQRALASSPADALGPALALARPAWVVLSAATLAATVASFAQVGPLWAPKAASFDPARVDPLKGAKRLVSLDRVVDLVRHVAMLAVASVVAAGFASEAWPGLMRLERDGGEVGLAAMGELVFGLALRVGAVLAVFAVADVFIQRRRHRRELRMSLVEVKREHRETEGDPHGKQARARAHREAVEHGALEEVRRATVLVVNPTHFAVALRFDEESDQEAPEVVAKGLDELARKMIAVARESGVPVVRDVPLARALHEIELGEEIPEPFYQAVAAILEAAAEERERR